MKSNYSYCPVCDSNYTKTKQYDICGYLIEICAVCKSGYLEDAGNYNISQIYDKDYYENIYANYASAEQQIKYEFRRIIQRIEKLLIPDTNILEIGSAYGYFMDVAKERNINVAGIEISDYARTVALKRGHPIFKNIDEYIEKVNKKVNCVIMLDCIEHLQNPSHTFEKLISVIENNSYIYLTTGDISSMHAKLLGRYWRLIHPPYHIMYFTKNGIERYLKRFGYKVMYIKYFPKYIPARFIFGHLRIPNAILKYLNFPVPINLYDVMSVLAFRST